MAQLLAYRFAPGAAFEGQLVGALQRIESGGALRVLDVLFVGRDPETGDVMAIEARGRGVGGFVAPMLAFRLDPAARARATERALTPALRELAGTLEPGGALVAVLVGHVWAEALEDAVARTGGTRVADDVVAATTLDELVGDLLRRPAPL